MFAFGGGRTRRNYRVFTFDEAPPELIWLLVISLDPFAYKSIVREFNSINAEATSFFGSGDEVPSDKMKTPSIVCAFP